MTALPEVSIVIPAYGAGDLLLRCLKSLAGHVPPTCTVSVVDDATPDDSVRAACKSMLPNFPQLKYHRSDQNRGFVATCNFACQHLRKPGSDLLLLNSDTEVTPGFVEEMQAVLYLHERHGVVTPRSNNATIFSVPWNGGMLPAAESFEVWKRVRNLLPRFQVMPTAVGFCMLIKAQVLKQFGLFDEIYSPGYNEENDFVCRINRGGYSAVAANQAYVFHNEASSFGALRRSLETMNSQTLADRYPEYERKVSNYYRFFVDPVEIFAGLYAPHRPKILFDFFDEPERPSGGAQAAIRLFKEVTPLLQADVEIHAGFHPSQTCLARELAGYRAYEYDPGSSTIFDLVFRPSQPLRWKEFARMNGLAPRVTYLSLGMMGVRADYLNSVERQIVFRNTAELSDHVFTISDFVRTDFETFYGTVLPMRVIDLARNAAEQYATVFREILATDLDIAKLRKRWSTLRLLESPIL